jgi:hypothetical protein
MFRSFSYFFPLFLKLQVTDQNKHCLKKITLVRFDLYLHTKCKDNYCLSLSIFIHRKKKQNIIEFTVFKRYLQFTVFKRYLQFTVFKRYLQFTVFQWRLEWWQNTVHVIVKNNAILKYLAIYTKFTFSRRGVLDTTLMVTR